MFIRNLVGIITLKRSPKWIKFFHRLTLGTVHISYLKEVKHQTCQCFYKFVKLDVTLNHDYKLLEGGGKVAVQDDQTLCKVIKYLTFCCSDVSSGWNVPKTVVHYCLGSVNMLSDFVEYLQNKWKIGFSGIIGYMNLLAICLIFEEHLVIQPLKMFQFFVHQKFICKGSSISCRLIE